MTTSYTKIFKFISSTENKAPIGYDLVVSRGNTKSGTESICAPMLSIPESEVRTWLPELMPHILKLLSDERAKVLREVSSAGLDTISDSAVTITALLRRMESEVRLTAQSIKDYMGEAEVVASLEVILASKLGWEEYVGKFTAEQQAKLDALVAGLVDTFSELSGRKISWDTKRCNKALEYLELLPESGMRDRLIGKVTDVRDRPVDTNILDVLGF